MLENKPKIDSLLKTMETKKNSNNATTKVEKKIQISPIKKMKTLDKAQIAAPVTIIKTP